MEADAQIRRNVKRIAALGTDAGDRPIRQQLVERNGDLVAAVLSYGGTARRRDRSAYAATRSDTAAADDASHQVFPRDATVALRAQPPS